jgi:hypothetical protein
MQSTQPRCGAVAWALWAAAIRRVIRYEERRVGVGRVIGDPFVAFGARLHDPRPAGAAEPADGYSRTGRTTRFGHGRRRGTRNRSGEPVVWRPMSIRSRAARRAPLVAVVVLVVVAGACSAVAAPSASGPAVTAPRDLPTGSPADGGGTSGNPGTGVGGPVDPAPVDPAPGQPTLVTPKPGRLDPHPVAPIRLQASVDGRHVLVKVSWYGGIAPCSVLDSVQVEQAERAIALASSRAPTRGT